jgi:hypothetical protein
MSCKYVKEKDLIPMDMQANNVALVTGSSSGIGI